MVFRVLLGLSLLELILITTMVKLHEIREGPPLNFEAVFHGQPGFTFELDTSLSV